MKEHKSNLDINNLWKKELTNLTSDFERMLVGQIPIIDQCEMWKCTSELQRIAHAESQESIEYMQLADGSFDETFRGPEWHD